MWRIENESQNPKTVSAPPAVMYLDLIAFKSTHIDGTLENKL